MNYPIQFNQVLLGNATLEIYVDTNEPTNDKNFAGCEFTAYKKDLPIVVGNNHFSSNLFNMYWWAESEYNAVRGRYGPLLYCSQFCDQALVKFWFNRFSDATVGYFPGYERTLGAYKAIEENNIQKDGDILIMISNCVEERAQYVASLLTHLEEEFPDIIIRKCGSCFDQHPECPSRREHSFNQQITWIARHRYVLSFENSLCPNYVTEKLYHPINAGSVPIIQSLYPFPDFLDPVRDHVIISDEFVDYLKTHDYKNSWKDLIFEKEEWLDISKDFPRSLSGACAFIKNCVSNITDCTIRQTTKRDAERNECMKSCENSFECMAPFADYNPRNYTGNY